MPIDIEKIKSEARAKIQAETTEKATDRYLAQLRRVEAAKQNVIAQQLILDDIEAQIADGTLS